MYLSDYTPFEFTLMPPPFMRQKISQLIETRWPKTMARLAFNQLNHPDQATFYHCLYWLGRLKFEQGKLKDAKTLYDISEEIGSYLPQSLTNLVPEMPTKEHPMFAPTWVETMQSIKKEGFDQYTLRRLDFTAAATAFSAYMHGDDIYTFRVMEYREFINICRNQTEEEILKFVLSLDAEDLWHAKNQVYELIDGALHLQIATPSDEHYLRIWDMKAMDRIMSLGISPKATLPIEIHKLARKAVTQIRLLNAPLLTVSIFDRWLDVLLKLSHDDPVWWPLIDKLLADTERLFQEFDSSNALQGLTLFHPRLLTYQGNLESQKAGRALDKKLAEHHLNMAIQYYQEAMGSLDESNDLVNWLVPATNLIIAYDNHDLLEQAGLLCQKMLAKLSEKELLSVQSITAQIIYAKYLVASGRNETKKVAEAFTIYSRLHHITHSKHTPMQALEVALGLAKCWELSIPREPKAEDILPIAEILLEAFEQQWLLSLTEEERVLLLKFLHAKLDHFVRVFAKLIPIDCLDICEAVRSRQMLADLGYTLGLYMDGDVGEMLTQEAKYTAEGKTLNQKLMLAHQDHDFDTPSNAEKLADVKQNLTENARILELIRYQLAQLNEESIAIRRGRSLPFNGIKRLLENEH